MILSDITTIDGGLNAVYAGFLSLCALVLNSLVTWLRNIKPKKELTGNIEKLVADVDAMKAELKTNGGSSVKDVVGIIHKDVKLCTESICQLQNDFNTMRAQERVRLEMQLNSSNEAEFLCNEKGDCTFANKKLQVLFGLSKESMMDSEWLKAIENQREKRHVHEEWCNSVEERISFSMGYTIVNQQTGVKQKVLAKAEPIWDEKGILMWFYGNVKPI